MARQVVLSRSIRDCKIAAEGSNSAQLFAERYIPSFRAEQSQSLGAIKAACAAAVS